MLHLICGRAGSGKTARLRTLVKSDAENGGSPLLIVPEQYSFETERAVLSDIGAAKMSTVTVTGFSRLALSVIKERVPSDKPFADDGVRAVLMSEAISALEGNIKFFARMKDNPGCLSELVELNKECKNSLVKADDFAAAADKTGAGLFSDKLRELSLIENTFDALLAQSYFDDTEALTVFCDYAEGAGWFNGKTVYVDAFRAFSGQELRCLEIIMKQSKDVFVTLCTDPDSVSEDSPFLFMDDFRKRLIAAANRAGVSVALPERLPESCGFSENISYIEKNLYYENTQPKSGDDGSVKILSCRDAEDEYDTVSAEIHRLVREEGYRYRDIGIIERTAGSCRKKMVHSLRRTDIPVYDDSRRALKSEPVFMLVSAALETVSGGFNTEPFLKCLKTGLTSLTVEEVCSLENYQLLWDISGTDWTHPFMLHPDGYCEKTDDSDRRLCVLEELRQKAVIPLLTLRKAFRDGLSGADCTKALYNLLTETGAADKVFDLSMALRDDGFPTEARRNADSWAMLMGILERLAALTGTRVYSAKRYMTLFSLLCGNATVGEIPQGLDEVTIGSADRIRTEQLKVVFLIGVNRDRFPLVVVPGGILTDSDRTRLNELGVEVRASYASRAVEERFIVYCAVTAASEKLYLSYRVSGEADAHPSELIDNIGFLLPDAPVVDYRDSSPLNKVENTDTAFRTYASICRDESRISDSLYYCLSEYPEYSGKLSSMAVAAGNKPFEFEDSKNSKSLFGESLRLSASRVESFYQCAFSYFCQYGLKIQKLRKAKLDPRQSGTLIHYVLENVLREYTDKGFAEIRSEVLKARVDELLSDYLHTNMGGADDKSKRFMYLFERLSDILMTILSRLQHEFRGSAFVPHDFELKIGGEKVPAYTLPLSDGNTVSVTGAVDRVDLMERDGITYLRVVDYKTGKKDFRLASVLDGLNIQMLLYLFALGTVGESYYGKTVPAGVLYLPSRIGLDEYLSSRSPSDEEVEATVIKSGKLSGMVLDSPVVLNGMGLGVGPSFLPVEYKADGGVKGNYYSLSHCETLKKRVDKLITDMANELSDGKIPALPAGKNGTAHSCEYCEYRSVCGFEDGDKIRPLRSDSHKAILSELEAQNNDS